MIGPLSQCSTCARLQTFTETGLDMPVCEAFPGGIPDAVWTGTYDHRKEVPGDHGIRWQPLDASTKFPDWALADKTDGVDNAPDNEAAAA